MTILQNQQNPKNLKTLSSNKKSKSKKKQQIIYKNSKSRRNQNNNSSQIVSTDFNESLAQKVLFQLGVKYKNFTGVAGTTPKNSQKLQMIDEMQALASTLIKTENKCLKQKLKHQAQQSYLKSILDNQEEQIASMQYKINKLEKSQIQLQNSNENLRYQLQNDNQKYKFDIIEKNKKLEEQDQKLYDQIIKNESDKKQIIIQMERELQSQLQQQNKKNEIKVNSLQSIIDQLNVKLQNLQNVEGNYEQLQQEQNLNQSKVNQFQEQFQYINQLNQQLNGQNLELVQQYQDYQVDSQNTVDQLNQKVEQIKAKFELKIQNLKKDHQCEIQKYQISQGMIEDNQNYIYEEKLTVLQMKLKQKQELLDENQKQVQFLQDQINIEKIEFQKIEKKFQEYVNDQEQEKENIFFEAKNNKNQVHHLQKIIKQKDEALDQYRRQQYKIQEINSDNLTTHRSFILKDELLNNMQNRINQYEKDQKDLQSMLDLVNLEKQQIQQAHQKTIQNMNQKNEVQQQEIQILAQGFQAQQAKFKQQTQINRIDPQYNDKYIYNDFEEANMQIQKHKIHRSNYNEFTGRQIEHDNYNNSNIQTISEDKNTNYMNSNNIQNDQYNQRLNNNYQEQYSIEGGNSFGNLVPLKNQKDYRQFNYNQNNIIYQEQKQNRTIHSSSEYDQHIYDFNNDDKNKINESNIQKTHNISTEIQQDIMDPKLKAAENQQYNCLYENKNLIRDNHHTFGGNKQNMNCEMKSPLEYSNYKDKDPYIKQIQNNFANNNQSINLSQDLLRQKNQEIQILKNVLAKIQSTDSQNYEPYINGFINENKSKKLNQQHQITGQEHLNIKCISADDQSSIMGINGPFQCNSGGAEIRKLGNNSLGYDSGNIQREQNYEENYKDQNFQLSNIKKLDYHNTQAYEINMKDKYLKEFYELKDLQNNNTLRNSSYKQELNDVQQRIINLKGAAQYSDSCATQSQEQKENYDISEKLLSRRQEYKLEKFQIGENIQKVNPNNTNGSSQGIEQFIAQNISSIMKPSQIYND